jgi:hypothetical protein
MGYILAGAAILHFAFSRFVYETVVRIFFVGTLSSVPTLPVYFPEVAVMGFIVIVVLAVKAKDRLLEWSYFAPPAIVALWFCGVFGPAAAREAKHTVMALQYENESIDLRTKMEDSNFLMNLKPPLSPAVEDAVLLALWNDQRVVGTPLTSAEVNAILRNLGSDLRIQKAAGGCRATSVDDLQWLALHGSSEVREAVGRNPHTPNETIRRLMDDPEPDVRFMTGYDAMNRCDAEILRTFWNREGSKDLIAVRTLAANPCAPKDILRKLEAYPAPVGPQAKATLQAVSTGSKSSATKTR